MLLLKRSRVHPHPLGPNTPIRLRFRHSWISNGPATTSSAIVFTNVYFHLLGSRLLGSVRDQVTLYSLCQSHSLNISCIPSRASVSRPNTYTLTPPPHTPAQLAAFQGLASGVTWEKSSLGSQCPAEGKLQLRLRTTRYLDGFQLHPYSQPRDRKRLYC